MFGIYDPDLAKVGKLYRIRFHGGYDDDELPSYFVFDTNDRHIQGRMWKAVDGATCLVVKQTKHYVIVLVGEDLIHLHVMDLAQVSLIPVLE